MTPLGKGEKKSLYWSAVFVQVQRVTSRRRKGDRPKYSEFFLNTPKNLGHFRPRLFAVFSLYFVCPAFSEENTAKNTAKIHSWNGPQSKALQKAAGVAFFRWRARNGNDQ